MPRSELNPRLFDHESNALPLHYRATKGPWRATDLRLCSPQQDTIRSRKTIGYRPVYLVACPLTAYIVRYAKPSVLFYIWLLPLQVYHCVVRVCVIMPRWNVFLQCRQGRVISSADWKLDPQELASKFNSKTKMIIINNPNNPLGKVSLS